MSQVTKTPIPLPGASPRRPTKAKRTSPKSSQLSKEIVSSSDDSGNETTTQPQPTKKPTKQKKSIDIAVHRPKTNGVQKPTSSKTPIPIPRHSKKDVNQAREISSLESDESDDDAAENAPKYANQKKRDFAAAYSSESESESSTVSSSESSNEVAYAPAQIAQKEYPGSNPSHIVESRPTQPYVPPKGFEALSIPIKASSPAVTIFEQLEGKRIWHITAPAGVPIREIKQVALDQALKGEAILNYKGIDYGFSTEENEAGARNILLPHQNGYKTVSAPITQTLRLQQVIRLPHLNLKQADPNLGSEAAASITQSTIRAPRPQLKGLRMHYFPSGFGDEEPGTLGSSDSEIEASTPARLGAMNGALANSNSEKRKHDQEDGEIPGSVTTKPKKRRTPEELKRREERRAKKEKKREKEKAKAKQ
ncbi:hypothetical protein CC78DRAFT_617593 [Lojkania enalia]|uniref:DNA-directed RNA polymerase I subunit RPA34.5 n=1 Tax=Lojkania enalia TaxID=147567 RepID=A0A9P4K897_9PLEO|nr:hypothetical protein CC78DRAFT_617593 [Didymosphaeria enalia]